MATPPHHSLLPPCSTVMVGRLGSSTLSAWVLAHTFLNITGLSLVLGAVSALETFAGQAFGARRYAALGIVLQRAMLVSFATALPCCLVWLQAERILVALGQDAGLSRVSGLYVRLYMPVLFLTAASECCRRTLIAQGIVLPAMITSAMCTALTPVFLWLFIFRLGYGLNGSAFATTALSAINLIVLFGWMAVINMRRRPELRTWAGLDNAAWKQWPQYLRVALPATAMICADWWSFEAFILLAGLLPNPHITVAAMGIAFNTHAWFFMWTHALGAAVSTRVSNALGGWRPSAAKLAAEVGAVIGVLLMVIAATVLGVERHSWGRIFTADPAVAEVVARLMPPLAASLVGNGAITVLYGVLRGAGRQRLGAIVSIGLIWGVGIPSSVLLAFQLRGHGAGLGVVGFWWAQLGVSVAMAALLSACLMRFNWMSEAGRAASRVHAVHGAALPEQHQPLLSS